MTQKVREIISSNIYESIFVDESLSEKISFEQNMIMRLKPYYGKTVSELCSRFGVLNKPKNILEILFGKMLGINGKISRVEEFAKADIIPKFIRLKKNEKITESMSFPAFKFIEVYKNYFENSEVYEYFTTKKFLFVVFKYNKQNELYFSHFKLWNMPMMIIEHDLRWVYEQTRELIIEGNIVKSIDMKGRRNTNFPNKGENNYVHVRPHAKNKFDVYELPVEDGLTKQKAFTKHCFWLNNSYVSKIVGD